MFYLGMLALAVGLGLPIAVIGAGIGQGIAASAALGGIARQPEAAPKIQTAMIIALALIESLVIYALLMFFLLQGKLPNMSAEQAVSAQQASISAPAGR
jgi:F-type H+-transporting ATPase subunit c